MTGMAQSGLHFGQTESPSIPARAELAAAQKELDNAQMALAAANVHSPQSPPLQKQRGAAAVAR